MIEIEQAKMRLASMSVGMQNHGDQEVPVTYLKCEIDVSAQELAMFSSTARDAWFDRSDPPQLRVKEVTEPYDIEGKVKGATVTIHRGLNDEKSNLRMVDCDVDDYKLEPKNGGGVTFFCKIACFPGDSQLGHLYRGQRKRFEITIAPAQAEMLDDKGAVKAPRKGAKEAKEGAAELH